jgi:integrase
MAAPKRKRRCCVTLDLGRGDDGKRKRKYFYGSSKRQAERKRDEFRSSYRPGMNVEGGKQSVQQFLENWLENFVRVSRRTRTYESYKEVVRMYIVPHVGACRLERLTPEHIDRMIAALQNRGLAPRTVQYACGVLSRALNRAVKKHRWVDENVVSRADVPAVPRNERAPLTPEQAQRFLDVLKGHRLEPLYRVAISLGMRKGEILNLRWSDVDFSAGELRIVSSKTEAGVRTLPIPSRLLDVLQAHRKRQQSEFRVYAVKWVDDGYIFTSEVGTRILEGNLHRHFKGTLERAGLPHSVRFHDLRHSCACFLFAQGVHPRTVMSILGHSSMRTTMEIYGHTLDKSQQDALEKITTMFDDAE